MLNPSADAAPPGPARPEVYDERPVRRQGRSDLAFQHPLALPRS
jgi:hypothetical protein